MSDILKKQAAEQAPVPPPAYIREMRDVLEKDTKMEPSEHRDKLLIDFADSELWDKYLKKIIASKLNEYAQLLRKASRESGDVVEIGHRFMATDMINDFATWFINLVENPLKIKKAEAETKD